MDRVSRTKRRRRRIAGLVAAPALALGVMTATAVPAQAWTYGNVWLNFGDWNCGAMGGGSVQAVRGAIDGVSSLPAGGDWGDRTVYMKARVGSGSYNTFNGQVYCKAPWYRGWASQWVGVYWKQFSPSYNGQGFTF